MDWGTSNLRAYLLEHDNVLDDARSTQGFSSLAPDQFESALLSVIEPWLSNDEPTTVLACGMVGARQGWIEAPYQYTPHACNDNPQYIKAPVKDPRFSFHIAPGVAQKKPADVMRGEETQIKGLLHTTPDYEGAICLPGTHSKWVRIQQGSIHFFETHMTGELYKLLSEHSTLQYSLEHSDYNASSEIFIESVQLAMHDPEQISTRLFAIRAGHLLHNHSPAENNQRLSGYLIGLELVSVKSYWAAGPVTLIGNDTLSNLYSGLLASFGCVVHVADTATMTLHGLINANAKKSQGLSL